MNEYEFESPSAVDNQGRQHRRAVVMLVRFSCSPTGMPVLLILVIQGCIWLNFPFPTITGKCHLLLRISNCFFHPDGREYRLLAIVIATLSGVAKSVMQFYRDAIVETLNFVSFLTTITCLILPICGFLIGSMTSGAPSSRASARALGCGTVISIIMVMFALPQILHRRASSTRDLAPVPSHHGKEIGSR